MGLSTIRSIGSGNGPIWLSAEIGQAGSAEPTTVVYSVNPGLSEQFNFNYPSQKIKTAWAGAKLQLWPIDNKSTYTSDNETVATVVPNGTVTIHAAGEMRINITSSKGILSFFTLNPECFFVPHTGAAMKYQDASIYFTANNLKFPSINQLTLNSEGIRGVGALWDEWGDFDKNGSSANWPTSSNYKTWSNALSPIGHYVVLLKKTTTGSPGSGGILDYSDVNTADAVGIV